MKVEKKWRVGLMLFLVISLTASSVVLTITILNWNLKNVQRNTKGGDIQFENDSLSRHSLSLLQELAEGQIQKNNFREIDSTVTNIVAQFLSTVSPNDLPQYSTDTLLGIRYAVRHSSITDQRSLELREELDMDPAPHRQQEILDELNRIFAETTTRAGVDRITRDR